MTKKLTYEFVKDQFEKENYILISKEYINANTKLEVKCNNGHEYSVTYASFYRGHKCPYCYGNIKLTYEYIKEQIEKERYKLLSKEYKNNYTKLEVKCSQGHEYKVSWNDFDSGYRCPYCYGNKKQTYEYIKEFIEKEEYELLSKKYKNNSSKLKIKCPKGHVYPVTWNSFQQGCRCPYCSNKQKLTYEYVKEQIEKEGYELLSKEYKNANAKLDIKCPKNHEYSVKYGDFYTGYRCPICFGSHSKAEKEIVDYLKSLNIDIIENDRNIIGPLELDIVIPEHKLAIEYCGLYWHSELYKDKNYHLNKLKECKKNGYRLITIFEDEWLNKKDIVKNRLKYFLGLNTKRIYARKCEIREISRNEAKNFTDKYHIQGFANASIYLGAFHNNKLVAVNTFVKRGLEYELNRFCVNNNIIGIASKFIKYFQRNYNYNKIITFADRRWSEGHLYEKIEFKKDEILFPDYSYFQYRNKIRYHKFNFRHKQMKNKLENYDLNLSEHQNMLNNEYYRIYDCGKIRYIIEKI